MKRRRWLVRLPGLDEIYQGPVASPALVSNSTPAASRRPKPITLTSASKASGKRRINIHFKATLKSPTEVDIRKDHVVVPDTATATAPTEGASVSLTSSLVEQPSQQLPPLEIIRNFEPLSRPAARISDTQDDVILQEILRKQSELKTIESGLQPRLQHILTQVVCERLEFESPEAVKKRAEQDRILMEHEKMLQLRKDMDLQVQKQLEQDMDAVCSICQDGDVTPDNQILFCEACNVAVHQVCYGIEKVPEGDYYCMPCTRLGRDKTNDQQQPGQPKPPPIVCELCPVKGGAFIETFCPNPYYPELVPNGSWVHMVCAKWQGLDFHEQRTDLIEDVTEFKKGFRQRNVVCCICKGARGAMQRCRLHHECKNWLHVTCAREVGTCQVIHGQDAAGLVDGEPWTLLCPSHTNRKASDIPPGSVSQQTLIQLAKKLPPEPIPQPLEVVAKPFNTLDGAARDALLRRASYEQDLLREVTTKKMFGYHCEVCDIVDIDGRNMLRCTSCLGVICYSCTVPADTKEATFRCPSCRFLIQKRREKATEVETPKCISCCQPTGLLREAFAEPVSRRVYWKTHPNEKKRSMFGKPIWVHFLCALYVYFV